MRACVRACVRVCVCVCARAFVCVFTGSDCHHETFKVWGHSKSYNIYIYICLLVSVYNAHIYKHGRTREEESASSSSDGANCDWG